VEAPGLVEPIWKAAGIVLLGLSAAFAGASFAAAALFASSAGDFFLELKPSMMIAGMASFALAHLFFIAAFALRIGKGGMRTKNWPVAASVVAASIAMLIWLWPDLGELGLPVAGYHAVLTAMVVASILAPVSRWAPIGAVVFLVSDAIIGLGLFKGMEDILAFNWPVYAGAQIMLALSLMRNAR
ncbi:MAG: lysoplasmalogenase, partial [Parvularculaceae bacterium]